MNTGLWSAGTAWKHPTVSSSQESLLHAQTTVATNGALKAVQHRQKPVANRVRSLDRTSDAADRARRRSDGPSRRGWQASRSCVARWLARAAEAAGSWHASRPMPGAVAELPSRPCCPMPSDHWRRPRRAPMRAPRGSKSFRASAGSFRRGEESSAVGVSARPAPRRDRRAARPSPRAAPWPPFDIAPALRAPRGGRRRDRSGAARCRSCRRCR